MDMENKALKEAFNKKYGELTPENRKKMGISDEEWEQSKKNFAKKFYGLDKKEEPSFFQKIKDTVSGVVEMNSARKSGDADRINKAYSTSSRGF
jgi:hypothetical protein